MKKVMLVFGTRPEAIKMCPLVNELKKRKELQTVVCVTGQHRQMLDMVLEAFSVTPDYDLSIMKDKQTLFDVTTNILNRIKEILEKERPDHLRHHFSHSTHIRVIPLKCVPHPPANCVNIPHFHLIYQGVLQRIFGMLSVKIESFLTMLRCSGISGQHSLKLKAPFPSHRPFFFKHYLYCFQ